MDIYIYILAWFFVFNYFPPFNVVSERFNFPAPAPPTHPELHTPLDFKFD